LEGVTTMMSRRSVAEWPGSSWIFRERVLKHCRGLLERNAVLKDIGRGFRGVPLERGSNHRGQRLARPGVSAGPLVRSVWSV
jgi:hypothetical protein